MQGSMARTKGSTEIMNEALIRYSDSFKICGTASVKHEGLTLIKSQTCNYLHCFITVHTSHALVQT